jgi:riboflavin biosynthesis pyrimidine reductase
MFGDGVPEELPSDFEKPDVDLTLAVDRLKEKFSIAKILTDTGRIMGNILINKGMADEISLLVHPLIVGEKCY